MMIRFYKSHSDGVSDEPKKVRFGDINCISNTNC